MKKLFLIFCLFLGQMAFAFDASIPVLNLNEFRNIETRGEFLEKLKCAAHESGFFALEGIGIDQDVIDEAYLVSQEFFYLPREVKWKYNGKANSFQRGFAIGESAKGESFRDSKEFYHIGREGENLGLFPNVWPSEDFPEYKAKMITLYQSIEDEMTLLDEAFSAILGAEENILSEMLVDGDTIIRALYYPANPPEEGVWGAAHTDINLYTVLPRATAQGLQVLNRFNEWIDVHVPEGAFIINVGDMLQNLSNGYYKSALHRVVDPGLNEERFFLVMFFHPRSDVLLNPTTKMIEITGGKREYPNATRWELLEERLIDLGLASAEMKQDFVQSGAIEKFREVGKFSPDAEATLKIEGYVQ